ncbi:hypothetical protein T484DRAFT_1833166 [Baffinella frigidus]|nr:hypothetical protein T484DRAFT_1833166 [Cryptophyta sp. CCMP2293]
MGNNLPSVALGTGRTAVAVIAGYAHTCALLDDATVKCWGYNDYGQLGQGDINNRGDEGGEMGTTGASLFGALACEAGTFNSEVGTGTCETCPANAESSSGSALCQCSAGFAGTDGGACSACSDCDAEVTFTATVAMDLTEFAADKRDAYVG